mmetsp:Transcript_30561/g.88865  ORF Transcript_30561/g.88865 Transcript_30561/m.88865 type:complete len:925 (-) Transcript_30561:226-3000(-)
MEDALLSAASIPSPLLIFIHSSPLFPNTRARLPLSSAAFEEFLQLVDSTTAVRMGVFCRKHAQPDKDTHRKADKPTMDFYAIGTICRVFRAARGSDGACFLEVEGLARCEATDVVDNGGRHKTDRFRWAYVSLRRDQQKGNGDNEAQIQALLMSVQNHLTDFIHSSVNRGEKPTPGTDEATSNNKAASSPAMYGSALQAYIDRLMASSSSLSDGALTRASVVCDLAASLMTQASVEERQKVLEALDVEDRLRRVQALLLKVIEAHKLADKIDGNVQNKLAREVREQLIRRKMQELQKELRSLRQSSSSPSSSQPTDKDKAANNNHNNTSASEEDEDDVARLRNAISKAGMEGEALKAAKRELRRLEALQPAHPEYMVCRTYLETLVSVPWTKHSEDSLDVQRAREILDEDHYGLEEVKKRILQFLAVRRLRNDMKGPILCLSGPPGVGKTSLASSVAQALGREFHRISLGGVRDEAEIRGHRRTYIGALPGVIVQAMVHTGVRNPVLLLDEVNKLSYGNPLHNPSAALLEVLDPKQNHKFTDHYLGVPYDLSRVFFICTANTLTTMPRALRDRLEVVHISGYTMHEKERIAERHLIPNNLHTHGLTDKDGKAALEISPEIIQEIICKYTAESGVRELDRCIAAICRWAALKATDGDAAAASEPPPPAATAAPQSVISVQKEDLVDILGNEKYSLGVAHRLTTPGIAIGLAVNSTGGDILFIETSKVQGSGGLIVTGQLGEVMQESVRTALTILQAKALNKPPSDDVQGDIGMLPSAFSDIDLHVHFPAGAVAKDGPSAGLATTIALASLLTGRLVRSDTAWTGEVTLRGHVLPVGGIKEKVLAAHRAGICRVVLPSANKPQLRDIPKDISESMEFPLVTSVDEALQMAFVDDSETGEGTADEDSSKGRAVNDVPLVRAIIAAKL